MFHSLFYKMQRIECDNKCVEPAEIQCLSSVHTQEDKLISLLFDNAKFLNEWSNSL